VLKGHPAASQGDHLDQVHSDQIVLEMIRRGRLVRLSKAQQRPRVSKLRAKGLSGCHSSEQQLRQPDGGGAVGQIKGYSHDTFTKEKRERAERQLFAEAQKGKRQPTKEKASRLKRKNAYSRLHCL
jgi:hypothetical protein